MDDDDLGEDTELTLFTPSSAHATKSIREFREERHASRSSNATGSTTRPHLRRGVTTQRVEFASQAPDPDAPGIYPAPPRPVEVPLTRDQYIMAAIEENSKGKRQRRSRAESAPPRKVPEVLAEGALLIYNEDASHADATVTEILDPKVYKDRARMPKRCIVECVDNSKDGEYMWAIRARSGELVAMTPQMVAYFIQRNDKGEEDIAAAKKLRELARAKDNRRTGEGGLRGYVPDSYFAWIKARADRDRENRRAKREQQGSGGGANGTKKKSPGKKKPAAKKAAKKGDGDEEDISNSEEEEGEEEDYVEDEHFVPDKKRPKKKRSLGEDEDEDEDEEDDEEYSEGEDDEEDEEEDGQGGDEDEEVEVEAVVEEKPSKRRKSNEGVATTTTAAPTARTPPAKKQTPPPAASKLRKTRQIAEDAEMANGVEDDEVSAAIDDVQSSRSDQPPLAAQLVNTKSGAPLSLVERGALFNTPHLVEETQRVLPRKTLEKAQPIAGATSALAHYAAHSPQRKADEKRAQKAAPPAATPPASRPRAAASPAPSLSASDALKKRWPHAETTIKNIEDGFKLFETLDGFYKAVQNDPAMMKTVFLDHMQQLPAYTQDQLVEAFTDAPDDHPLRKLVVPLFYITREYFNERIIPPIEERAATVASNNEREVAELRAELDDVRQALEEERAKAAAAPPAPSGRVVGDAMRNLFKNPAAV